MIGDDLAITRIIVTLGFGEIAKRGVCMSKIGFNHRQVNVGDSDQVMVLAEVPFIALNSLLQR